MSLSSFKNSPPSTKTFLLSFPAPHIILITINRPDNLNVLDFSAQHELEEVFNWYNSEPELRAAIITGAGEKAFCAGLDIKSLDAENLPQVSHFPPKGFGGLGRRTDILKPIIAAVNGFAMGGGMEMVLACDIVVAYENSIFGLPEVKRGLVAMGGGLTRLVRFIGYQRACEIIMTGRNISAKECKELGIVNEIVSSSKLVIPTAMKYATRIARNSPDAVQASKLAILLSLNSASLTEADQRHSTSKEVKAWLEGENIKKGIYAFHEKRTPKWKNAKL
ncbi:15610_t:CDS:2 [Acaulospora morrowiae]|uniref:15610_t:CDS:1 n=1 Tax=Acaulospora morrowiae TaxID=94023 RepID=A0A9N9HU31_9GLOM|nr:15610_t:CDS:2 [Acaulospora morrowiae]